MTFRQLILSRGLFAGDGTVPPPAPPPTPDPAKVDPPKVDPPKVDPPKIDPPKVDPLMQTPEEKAAADKVAADKVIADKAAADAAETAKVTAIKNVLKLPEKSVLDAASLERTAANASALGLSPEHAQKMLDFVHQEVTAQRQAVIEAHAPGTGAAWLAQDQEWKTAALADPVLGNNKPETLEANVGLAKRVLATFGDDTSIDFLEKSGLGSHPGALRLLVKIGKAMGEGSLVIPSAAPKGARTEADVADSLYTSMRKAGE